MWDDGYSSNDSNEVCHHLTQWIQSVWGVDGEFLMLWSEYEDAKFEGDSELAYFTDGLAHLMPNPFIEGDAEGFIVALATILEGAGDSLYRVSIGKRVLYNAV